MSRRHPTAWDNFMWDVEDWIGSHMGWIVAALLGGLLFLGHAADAADAEEVFEDYELNYEDIRHEKPRQQCVEYANEEPEICDEKIKPEFRIENLLITVFYYDTLEAFREDTGETDPEVKGWSLCETKPDKNIAYCDFYVVMPEFVDDDSTLTFGHESLHGLLGDYHKNAPAIP